jgi:hypothetical protein
MTFIISIIAVAAALCGATAGILAILVTGIRSDDRQEPYRYARHAY